VILAVSAADERAARERIAMQRATGLDVRWVGRDEVRRLIPAMAATGYRGGSYVATDGWVDPPRNVRAYGLAMQRAGVVLRERTAFTGLRRSRNGRVTGIETTAGPIAAGRVLLTGGPGLRAVARAAGATAWVGRARHMVVVTEPSEAVHPDTTAMAFDIGAGIYWRPEEGGLLWGMSNPDERPGDDTAIDWAYLRAMERRLHRLLPATRRLAIRKAWAATIEYTPDHLPLAGPLVADDGDEVPGVSIASACGHGMMWGPAVARIAADMALTGRTRVVRRPQDLRMDRFDANGVSPFVDPVALPFPRIVDD
jgi:sarcosine oxidase subunit beta